MQAPGYDMDALLLYQDNMSAILLETNGKVSSTKQTKYIKVKYKSSKLSDFEILFFLFSKVFTLRILACPQTYFARTFFLGSIMAKLVHSFQT